jgi:O-antigen ligase
LRSPNLIVDALKGKVKLDWAIVAQVALTVLPAMLLFGTGHPVASSSLFFAILLLLLARQLVLRNALGVASLITGSLPVLIFLREFLFVGAQTAILGIGITCCLIMSPDYLSQFWNSGQLKWLVLLGGGYWLLSYALTGNPSSNLGILHLAFSATLVYLLARDRRSLSWALLGVALSVLSIGVALSRYGTCLGGGVVEEFLHGHTMVFALPLALVFLLAIADKGKWLLLEKLPASRVALSVTAGIFMLLSMRRGSLLVAIIGVMVIMIFSKSERTILVTTVVVVALVTIPLLKSTSGRCITKVFEKTFSQRFTLNQRSSGRYNQWVLFAKVFMDSPVWGFGPGSGWSVYDRYVRQAEKEGWLSGSKKDIVWHSLYLHVAVETGIIGILALVYLLIPPLVRGLRRAWITANVTPLLGILSFMVIGLSTTAMDAYSGYFLGLGFLGSRSGRFLNREGGQVQEGSPVS